MNAELVYIVIVYFNTDNLTLNKKVYSDVDQLVAYES